MANCSKCGLQVSCGCSLIEGACSTCYMQSNQQSPSHPFVQVNLQGVNAPQPVTFEAILNEGTLSKEEKLKRINDIIEKARGK